MSNPVTLPYGAILRESVVAVWRARRELVDFALLPMIYSLVLALLIYLGADGPPIVADENGQPVPGDPIYLLNLLIVVPTAMFLRGWIVRALHGGNAVDKLPGLRWSGAETRLLFAMIALTVGMVLVANIIGIVLQALLGGLAGNPAIAAFAVFVPAIYLCARFAPVLVITAENRPGGFPTAWKLSAGNGHRIAFVLIALGIGTLVITFVAVALVTMPLAALYGLLGGGDIGIGGNIATSIVSLLVYFAGAAIAAEALARICKALDRPAPPPAAND